MSKLVALRFDDPAQADVALARIEAARTAGDVAMQDALTISWSEGQRRPQSRRPFYLTIPGKGLETAQKLAVSTVQIFMTLGSAAWFVAGQLLKTGISADFVADVKDQIAAGSSILVLMTDEKSSAAVDTLLADLAPTEIGSNSFTKEVNDTSE